jgi:hypothetical protein
MTCGKKIGKDMAAGGSMSEMLAQRKLAADLCSLFLECFIHYFFLTDNESNNSHAKYCPVRSHPGADPAATGG